MNVDPCEDFYQFTCGRILNSTTKPETFFTWIIDEKIENKRKFTYFT